MKSIKITLNIYGNYGCFIGTEKVLDSGDIWPAREWLAKRVQEGIYKVSSKSVVSEEVARDFIAKYL